METTLQELDLPQGLNEARQKLLMLPGVDNYVPDTSVSYEEIDEGIESMVAEVCKDLDAENMVRFISFCLGHNEEEKAAFFRIPERQPFKSKVNFAVEFEERKKQFLSLGKYLLLRYRQVKSDPDTPAEAKKRGDNLRTFYEFSTFNLYSDVDYKFDDKVKGVVDRDNKAKVDEQILINSRIAANEIALSTGEDEKDLCQNILAKTEEGYYPAFFSYLLNHRGSLNLRQVLQNLIEKRNNDKNLIMEKLRALWEIESYRMEMGIELDLLYELYGYPPPAQVESSLHLFLQRDDLVNEMKLHLKTEASKAYQNYESAGTPIDFWQVLHQRAMFHQLPDEVQNSDQLGKKAEKIIKHLGEFLPPTILANTATSFIAAPVRVGSTLRPYNITYYNRDRQLIDVIVLNPREEEVILAKYTGGELGHRLHAYFVNLAETSGYLPAGSWEKITPGVKEEIAGLLEEQAVKCFRVKEEKSESFDGEWSDLWEAYLERRQAPYALVQLAVRREMQRRIKVGERELSDKDVEEIINKFSPQIDKLYSEGIAMITPNQSLLNNISLLESMDGLEYLDRFVKSEGESVAKTGGLREAFAARFADFWLDNPDALAILYALMAETGKRYEQVDFNQFIKSSDIAGTKSMLEAWGY